MKHFNLLFLLFLSVSSISFSQDKLNFNPKILDLGDAEILSSSTIESSDFVSQEFTVKIATTDRYYLAAWIIGSFATNENQIEYRFSVNENKEYVVMINKSGPQPLNILDQSFDLRAGTNSITISTRKPCIPNIEFIKVSLDKQSFAISAEKYDQYINNISNLKLPDNYAALKKETEQPEQPASNLKSYELVNPSGNYDHEMDVDFSYSFSTYIGLDQGQTYTIETKNATSDPVLHVFYKDYPSGFTRTADEGGSGYNAKLTFTAPYTGNYRVFIRKNSDPASVNGTCDLFISGQIGGYYLNEVPIGYYLAYAGTEIACPKSVSETLNWFTADLSGADSRIWVVNTSSPERIIAENDDWTVDSDFDWGHASRIRSNLSTSISGVIVSGGSYAPSGSCDMYMNCKNGNLATAYTNWPNLKANDAIQSAPYSNTYNCISWSGGMDYVWSWPISVSSGYCVKTEYSGQYCDSLLSFEKFYDSVRYEGATRYEITGESENSVIDLWYNSTDHEFTHASVRKPGNNYPHGYDWESKPGPLQRTFHPRNSLYNNAHKGYGFVSVNFVPVSEQKKILMQLDESIARGLSKIEYVDLNLEELTIINESLNLIPPSQLIELQAKYNLWKKTWKELELYGFSDPKKYASSKE
ncbi:MAG: PPC domain-containing protein [Bacteroidales bacterium]|nr:PPC domain-containing protein [Bacteroidales bacterium]